MDCAQDNVCWEHSAIRYECERWTARERGSMSQQFSTSSTNPEHLSSCQLSITITITISFLSFITLWKGESIICRQTLRTQSASDNDMAQSLRLMTKRSQCTSEYLFTIARHNKSSISASQTRQSVHFSSLRFQYPCQSMSTQLHQLQASSTSRWSRAKVESSTIRRSPWDSETLKCFSSSAGVFQTSHDKR